MVLEEKEVSVLEIHWKKPDLCLFNVLHTITKWNSVLTSPEQQSLQVLTLRHRIFGGDSGLLPLVYAEEGIRAPWRAAMTHK